MSVLIWDQTNGQNLVFWEHMRINLPLLLRLHLKNTRCRVNGKKIHPTVTWVEKSRAALPDSFSKRGLPTRVRRPPLPTPGPYDAVAMFRSFLPLLRILAGPTEAHHAFPSVRKHPIHSSGLNITIVAIESSQNL